MDNSPYILKETENYAVVYKPPKMHCVPIKKNNTGTLLDWYNGHIMHRLDYETHGLVLFAKNDKSYEYFKDLQDRGEFVKEYSAICVRSDSLLETVFPFTIESYFRPFGPGRKLVRPVTDETKTKKEIVKDKGGFYCTEIISLDGNVFTVRIKRGFRHQIRCHLSWIGCPILNDPLYPDPVSLPPENYLALRAHAVFFKDPADGGEKESRILKMSDYVVK